MVSCPASFMSCFALFSCTGVGALQPRAGPHVSTAPRRTAGNWHFIFIHRGIPSAVPELAARKQNHPKRWLNQEIRLAAANRISTDAPQRTPLARKPCWVLRPMRPNLREHWRSRCVPPAQIRKNYKRARIPDVPQPRRGLYSWRAHCPSKRVRRYKSGCLPHRVRRLAARVCRVSQVRRVEFPTPPNHCGRRTIPVKPFPIAPAASD